MKVLEEFGEPLEHASSEEALRLLFSKAVKALGYDGFDAFCIKNGTIEEPEQPGNFFINDYDLDLPTQYIEKSYTAVDPSLEKLSTATKPFNYVKFLSTCRSNSSVYWQRATLKVLGIKFAWLIPFNANDAIRGVTIYMRGNGPEREQRFYDTRDELHLLSTRMIDRLIDFYPEDNKPVDQETDVEITTREIDCLTWIAKGKTRIEVAKILDISENTVRFHLKNAFQKLGENTRIGAVREATRRGLIE